MKSNLNTVVKLIIASDFSDAPGARYRTDGPKSGQEFYEDYLRPRFEEAIDKGGALLIDMDNTWGYASSFISGSFGSLCEVHGEEKLIKHIRIKSDDDPLLVDKICLEIRSR